MSWEGSIHRVAKALDALGLPVARLLVPPLLCILAHQLRHLPLVQLRLLRRAHDLWLDAQCLKSLKSNKVRDLKELLHASG